MKTKPETKGRQATATAPEAQESRTGELTPAQLRGQRRSSKVAKRILDAVGLIRRELEANNGVYPFNNTEVSLAEIARRAGVHKGTYYTPAQKDKEAHKAAQALVDELAPPEGRSEEPTSRKKTLQERLMESTLMYVGLSTSHDLTELHLQDAEAERDKAREERGEAVADRDKAIAEKHALQAQLEDLLQRLAIAESKNVRPLRPK